MIRGLIPATLLVALPASAAAQDARLSEQLYDPARVVRIDGRTKVQATIQFAEDERIENVAIGDSQAWQVTPNKRANLLFVKPLSAGASTNMTVVTDRRTYLFDLVASANARPLYVMRFTYPTEPEKPETPVTGPNEVEMAAAADPKAVVDPAALNFAWSGKGERKLLPSRTYDDGVATFVAWPAGSALPAILVRDEAGTEGPVNFAVRGDVIVIEGVPREIVLRAGKATATLVNTARARAVPAPSSQASLARAETATGVNP